MTEEWHELPLRAPLLAFDVDLAVLALRDDVVFTKESFGCFAEGFFCFDFSATELSS